MSEVILILVLCVDSQTNEVKCNIITFCFVFCFAFSILLVWSWIVGCYWNDFWILWTTEPIVKNGRPPTSHSMHSFLHQYTGSFKKPPLRRPHSVIGGSLGSFMAMPRNGSRLGNLFVFCFVFFNFLTVGYVHSY